MKVNRMACGRGVQNAPISIQTERIGRVNTPSIYVKPPRTDHQICLKPFLCCNPIYVKSRIWTWKKKRNLEGYVTYIRELKHRRPWATNGNRKLTVPFVGLFLLLVLDWKTLVLMSSDLPLQIRWCQNASKENKLTSRCRSRLTDVCA